MAFQSPQTRNLGFKYAYMYLSIDRLLKQQSEKMQKVKAREYHSPGLFSDEELRTLANKNSEPLRKFLWGRSSFTFDLIFPKPPVIENQADLSSNC